MNPSEFLKLQTLFPAAIQPPPIVKRPGFVAKPFTAVIGAGGWDKNGDASFTLTESPQLFNGNKAIRITNVTGSDSFTTIRSVVGIDTLGCSGKVAIPVFIPENLAVGVTIEIMISDTVASDPPTSTPAANKKFTFQPSQFKRGQWQILTVNFDASATTTPNPIDGTLVVSTGTVNTNNIKQIQIYGYLPATGDKYYDVGPITFGTLATPNVMLCFDGAGQDLTHFYTVLPVLAKYGFTACFSIQGQLVPICGNAIRQLIAAGMEVSNEGLNHTNYLNNPSTFTADLATNTANFDALSLDITSYKNIFTAPQNALSTTQIKQLVAAGYVFVRAGNRSLTPISNLGFEPLTPIGQIPTATKTAAQLITALDTIELHGESTVLLFHSIPNITAGTATGTDVAKPDFEAFMAELALRVGQGRMQQSSCLGFVKKAAGAVPATGRY